MGYCKECKRDLPEKKNCPVCGKTKGVFIEMEMPESCYKCKFFSHSYSFVFENDMDECLVEKSLIMFDPEEGRPSWCPLKPVKGE